MFWCPWCPQYMDIDHTDSRPRRMGLPDLWKDFAVVPREPRNPACFGPDGARRALVAPDPRTLLAARTGSRRVAAGGASLYAWSALLWASGRPEKRVSVGGDRPADGVGIHLHDVAKFSDWKRHRRGLPLHPRRQQPPLAQGRCLSSVLFD